MEVYHKYCKRVKPATSCHAVFPGEQVHFRREFVVASLTIYTHSGHCSSSQSHVYLPGNSGLQHDSPNGVAGMEQMKVIMIGPDGCGKTLYLAVLLQQQFVANPKNRWRLHPVKMEQAAFLNQTFATLIDPDEDFPPPTRRGELIDYDFDLRVAGSHNTVTPLKLSYLDFPGDIVRVPQAGETDEFGQRVEDADVVMGLFDGLDVLRMMQHPERTPAQCLQGKYGSLLIWLARNKYQMDMPIHFVITKWDLLEEAGFSFAAVKAKLLQFPEFVRFTQREKKRVFDAETQTTKEQVYPPAHLIPMSALGTGFAELSGERMIKKGKTGVNPEDIILPLALAVCDGIRVRWDSNRERFTDAINDIISALVFVVEYVAPPPANLLMRMGTALFRWWESKRTNNSQLDMEWLRRRRAQYQRGELTVTDERSAWESLVSDLALQIAEFQSTHPESRLTCD